MGNSEVKRTQIWHDVHDRVIWWMKDMAFKPPELLSGRHGEHYFECMANDIADEATGFTTEPGSASRLDP